MTTIGQFDVLSLEAPEVAVALLGSVISTGSDDELVAIRLNEVEAYRGRDDPASHAFRGRTPRNGPMYGAAGTIYVYRSYGIHWCMNIVTGGEGDPQGVLLRGGTVTEGLTTVEMRRGRTDHLADGPGKLGQALAITGKDSGSMLTGGRVSLAHLGSRREPYAALPRVGISKGRDRLWRFLVVEDVEP